MNDYKVAPEVAEAEFERFVEAMDLDLDTAQMDDEDRKSLEQQKSRIVSAIQKGSLVVNDIGEPVYTPIRSENADAIHFREPTGASLMAMDRKKKNEDVGKMYAIMGDITGNHANRFAKMVLSDLKVCQAVTSLFLG